MKGQLLFTAVLCLLSIAFAQTIAWTTVFFDDFNRASLGNNYIALGGPPLPFIDSNRLCGTTQSGAFVNITLPTGDFVRISYDFTTNSSGGFESYALSTFNSIFALAGCDGGWGTSNCYPIISNGTTVFGNGTLTSLSINTWYRMETIFSSNGIEFSLYSIDMSNKYAGASFSLASATYTAFGILIGRSGLTCADNLLIESGTESIVAVGCDGGSGTSQCTPSIFSANPVRGTGVTMTVNTWYSIEVVIHEPSFVLTIKQGTTTLSTLSGSSPNNFYSQFGFLVGRQTDNYLTCADNFLIETSNDGSTYTSVFFDDFNRPNGPLGASYPPINGIAQPSINGQKACADVQSIGVYQAQINAPYKRLSWIFQAASIEGFESYAIAVANDTSVVPPASSGTDMIVILQANYSSIPDWNSFFFQYTASLAAFLGIPQNRLQVITVRSGSIIVTTRILNYPSSQPIAQGFIDYVANNPLNPPIIAGYTVISASLANSGNADGNPTVAWNVGLFDNFDRASLGNNYTSGVGVPLPFISNNKLCGTTQSLILFNVTAINYDYVRISYDFTASSNEGFESYAVSFNSNNGVYLSGCDGGWDQRCGTSIRELQDSSTQPQTIALATNTVYRFVTLFDNVDTRITFSILTADLSTTLTSVSYDAAYNFMNPFGVLVGRQGLSCIDNLLVQTGISTFLIAGCDGGYGGGGLCTPTIAAETKDQQAGVTMNIFNTYNMEVLIHEPSVTLTIKIGNSVLSQFTSQTSKFYNYFGILVGRNADNQLTCADNFVIETSSDGNSFTTVFSDNFNRPNGAPGANYSAIAGAPSASITSNQLCADVQSIAIYASPINAPYKRLRWTYTAADPQGFETYGVAISNRSNLIGTPSGSTLITVVLNGNISTVTNWGAFLAQFQSDVATQLGVPPSQILILNVRSGSIIVDTQILPSSPTANDAGQLANTLSSMISNGDIQSLGGYPAASATVVVSTSGSVTTGTAVSGAITTSVGTNTGLSTSDSTSSSTGGNEASSSDAAKVVPALALLASYFL